MAALQTIREKAGILVSIVIGVALLAFIVGDAITSGSSIINNERNTIGEINGESISIMTFQNRLTKQENIYKGRTGSALSEEAQRQLREQVWYSMIYTNVIGKEAGTLGLAVSDDEMYDMTYGNNISPLLFNTFGTQDPNELRGIIQYVIQNPQTGFDWNGLQEEIKNNRVFEKYFKLVNSSMYTTSVEKADDLAGMTKSYDVSYILKRFSTVPDSTINISDAEINEYYNEYPIEQTETRDLAYVAFDVNPTPEDRQKILGELNSLKDKFAETTTPENFININSYTKAAPVFMSRQSITNTELADFIFAQKDSVFGPFEEDGYYKMCRGFESRMMPDRIQLRHIIIAGQNIDSIKLVADAIVDSITSNEIKFEDAAERYSMDENSSSKGGDLGWLTYNQLPANLADVFFAAGQNEVSSIATTYGVHIYEVTDRSEPVQKIKVATVDREIRPSAATEMAATDLARTFAEGVTNLNELTEKAKAQGLSRHNAVVNMNDYMVNNMKDSRELIRRAFMTDEAGAVITNTENSAVFSFGNSSRVVAVLTNINQEGLMPMANRQFQIRYELMNRKKGAQLAEEMKKVKGNSSSLISISNQMKIDVLDASDVTFASSQFAESGFEPSVIGTISTMKEGEISEPIVGKLGVYLVMLNKINNKELSATQQQTEDQRKNYIKNMMLSQQLLPVLTKAAGMKDYRYKFY